MPLDTQQLVNDMLGAAKLNLGKFWKQAKPFAENETLNMANKLLMIEQLKLEGKITKEEALLHIDIQKSAFRTVLLSIKGLGLIAVEGTINAALGSIAKVVNKALGWGLL
ncbi:MAG: hypothetical protein K2Q24_03350 [Chitinophagaceae bacterium]|nr:hypothetical protein [Chitinophagaceae bacterium]